MLLVDIWPCHLDPLKFICSSHLKPPRFLLHSGKKEKVTHIDFQKKKKRPESVLQNDEKAYVLTWKHVPELLTDAKKRQHGTDGPCSL